MTLEAILKGSQAATAQKRKGRPPKKKPANQNFRPIISTRLQMQSAAKLAAESSKEPPEAKDDRNRRKDRKRWFMPRKSPRCHASTMAILCSKTTDFEPIPEEPAESCSSESQAAKEEPLPEGDLIRALQDMLIKDLEQEKKPEVRRRGRPPKKHRTVGKPKEQESSLAEFFATPLERLEDLVDERLLNEPEVGALSAEDEPMYPADWVKEPSPELPEVFHDIDSNSGSRSSSVYETASEIGSSSTGMSESNQRKVWKNRRKRRNMTGWPRSKKRKPVPMSIELEDEMTSDGGPPSLSPIREEPVVTDDGSEEDPPPPLQPSPGRYVSKPFQFQRKTLRFVGKRILRPAAQRHAPQRLEYWPCFTITSSSPPRPRPLPRKRRCK